MPRIIRINHIGIATESIEKALGFFSDALGLNISASELVGGDAAKVVFLPVGESRLELLEPQGATGPIQKFLAGRGPGVHHICMEVEDLTGMLTHLAGQGVELIDKEPRRGAHDTLVAFIHPRSANGILIELVETTSLQD